MLQESFHDRRIIVINETTGSRVYEITRSLTCKWIITIILFNRLVYVKIKLFLKEKTLKRVLIDNVSIRMIVYVCLL